MGSLLRNLHPKVRWPLIVNAVATAVLAIVVAATKGDRNAIVGAVVSAGMTIMGAVTGYTVSAPEASGGGLAGNSANFAMLPPSATTSGSGVAEPSTTPGGATPPGLGYPAIPEIPPVPPIGPPR